MIDSQPTVLSLTDAAASKLHELTKEETNPNVGLRVYVYSGGCSGYRYGMMLEDAPTAEDKVLEANGVKVYVDGHFRTTINLFSSTNRTRQLVFSSAWSASGAHKVKLVVVGTARHPRVDVDGFVVLR